MALQALPPRPSTLLDLAIFLEVSCANSPQAAMSPASQTLMAHTAQSAAHHTLLDDPRAVPLIAAGKRRRENENCQRQKQFLHLKLHLAAAWPISPHRFRRWWAVLGSNQ